MSLCRSARCGSEGDAVAALKPKGLESLVGRCDLKAKALDDLADLHDLARIGRGELARSDPKAVLEANTDVAAHGRRHRRDRHLVAPSAKHRPAVIVAEQAIGRSLHMNHVFWMRADAAKEP